MFSGRKQKICQFSSLLLWQILLAICTNTVKMWTNTITIWTKILIIWTNTVCKNKSLLVVWYIGKISSSPQNFFKNVFDVFPLNLKDAVFVKNLQTPVLLTLWGIIWRSVKASQPLPPWKVAYLLSPLEKCECKQKFRNFQQTLFNTISSVVCSWNAQFGAVHTLHCKSLQDWIG